MVGMTTSWNDDAVIAAIRRGTLRGVVAGANLVRNEVIRLIMETEKTGRLYRRRGVVHQASAPGEAPAVDTANHIRNITIEVDVQKLSASVVSSAAYAAALEFGTPNMVERPHMRRALSSMRDQVESAVAIGIRNEIGT